MEDAAIELTRLLGDGALDGAEKARRLLPLVYRELRAVAQGRLGAERPGHTLSATALVHETYIKMFGSGEAPWGNRAQFFAAAGEAMRQILCDHARARGRIKRGGGAVRVDWEGGATLAAAEADGDLCDHLALEEAFRRLKEKDPRAAGVVALRYYAGLTNAETAVALGISERTVKNDWVFARAWLARELGADGG